VDSTNLNLLTRDGAVAVEFHPVLAAEHYSELHDAVRDADSADDLRQVAQAFAKRRGYKVLFP
jgi:hypothetical protein